jgi:hypothetical protein
MQILLQCLRQLGLCAELQVQQRSVIAASVLLLTAGVSLMFDHVCNHVPGSTLVTTMKAAGHKASETGGACSRCDWQQVTAVASTSA